MAENPGGIIVYGTKWCAATQMLRRMLERRGIGYEFRDMDADSQAKDQVKWWTGGNASHPTVQIGGEILIEPTHAEVEAALASNGIR